MTTLCAQTKQIIDYFIMLRNEGFNKVGYYYSNLSTSRIKACGFNRTKLDAEIMSNNAECRIIMELPRNFEINKMYSKKEVKEILQRIYDGLGISRTAKSTDLMKLANCVQCQYCPK